jgi:hypothetical protein
MDDVRYQAPRAVVLMEDVLADSALTVDGID